jgi:hypothetical protein
MKTPYYTTYTIMPQKISEELQSLSIKLIGIFYNSQLTIKIIVETE